VVLPATLTDPHSEKVWREAQARGNPIVKERRCTTREKEIKQHESKSVQEERL
jgi:hypothetical protein